MDTHEYQAKAILSRFGVPVPRGGLAYSPEQASYRTQEIGGGTWMVKAQVHAGGRGQAGGVKICRSEREVADFAHELFGKRLVTRQSGPNGNVVYGVYVEEALDVARELTSPSSWIVAQRRWPWSHPPRAVWRSRNSQPTVRVSCCGSRWTRHWASGNSRRAKSPSPSVFLSNCWPQPASFSREHTELFAISAHACWRSIRWP